MYIPLPVTSCFTPADLSRTDAQDIVDQCDLRVYKPEENICVEVCDCVVR